MSDTERLLSWMIAAAAIASCSSSDDNDYGFDPDAYRCPTGDWCGTPADAAKVKSDAAQMVGDCPTSLSFSEAGNHLPWKEYAAMANDPAYAALPDQEHPAFDEAASKGRSASGAAETCCYKWTESCAGGRPLVVGDEAMVARAVAGSDWQVGFEPLGIGLPAETRREIAEGWIEDALAEHASIASFARATMELMAVGAPAELLAGMQRAGLDEIAHARSCFGLASAYGVRRQPGPLPVVSPRAPDLASVAVDTFVEACVGETTAALLAERCAAACEIEAVAAALRTIAADEARHAALGWRTLAWLARRDPAVLDRVCAIAAQLRPSTCSPEADAVRRAHGRPSACDRQRARFDAFTGVVEPMLAAMVCDRAA